MGIIREINHLFNLPFVHSAAWEGFGKISVGVAVSDVVCDILQFIGILLRYAGTALWDGLRGSHSGDRPSHWRKGGAG